MSWGVRGAVMLAVIAGCGNGSKPRDAAGGGGSAQLAVAATGTPESMLDGSAAPAAADGSGVAAAGATAFVHAAFDAKAAPLVTATCSSNKLRLTLDGVLFDFDRDSLQPGADDVLAQVKKAAVDPYPHAHIVVEGHTDSIGTDAHNDDLSVRRANTVASWLAAHGVDPSRVQAKGYGKRWPRVPNTSDANRAKNRRVEFVVLDQAAGSACAPAAAPIQGTPPPPQIDDGSGNADSGGGGGPGGGRGVAVDTFAHPPVGFSYYRENNVAASGFYADSCMTYDPSWFTGGPMIKGYDKGKQPPDPKIGKFVEHCPTDNVAASCDSRAELVKMEWWYAGATDAALAQAETVCAAAGGKWLRNRPAAAAPTARDRGVPAVVCGGSAEGQCLEILPSAKPDIIDTYKSQCDLAPHGPRCPPGAAVRCDFTDTIRYYYVDKDTATMARTSCEQSGGKWSTP